ncbi:RNA-directed DNA polymerase, eukaryota [Tanacetum coccineum]
MAARLAVTFDHDTLISKSIFVTNFPDNTTSKDLWEVCKGYGTVVDVFIPDRKSKTGKRRRQRAIEGDQNSKFFHGIISRKRANLAIKGVMVDGEQLDMLESPISRDEVRNAVWGCGENKSPGLDWFTLSFLLILDESLDIGDTQFVLCFHEFDALRLIKDCTVADKLQFSVTSSLRRSVRGGEDSFALVLPVADWLGYRQGRIARWNKINQEQDEKQSQNDKNPTPQDSEWKSSVKDKPNLSRKVNQSKSQAKSMGQRQSHPSQPPEAKVLGKFKV